jgi:peptidyl-tRNA hydrolase, PTH1 family
VADLGNKQYVFAGLGNPGKKYAFTRHNMGFLVIEGFAHLHKISLRDDKKLCAKVGKGVIGNTTVHLLMPTTYMNESGQAVRKFLDYFKLTPEDVVVVTDDAAIPFGEMRLRSQGTSGGHNGLKSVEKHLGSQSYARLRMGIGRGPHQQQVLRDFVLDPFNSKELDELPSVMNKGVKALELLLNESFTNVMNIVNSKIKPEEEKQNG